MSMKLIFLLQDNLMGESFIKANGSINRGKVLVGKSGQMAQFIKECGKIIWPMDKEDWYILEGMFMKDNG